MGTSPPEQSLTRREFDALAQRVTKLERAVKMMSSRTMVDQAPSLWPDSAGEPYYHKYNDLSGTLEQIVPWISTTTRFSERLTSTEFLKVTIGQAGVVGISFSAMGALAAWGFGYPLWPLIIVPGICGAVLSFAALLLVNRMEIHALVKGQSERHQRKNQRLEITVNKVNRSGKIEGIEELCVDGIQEIQLRTFAPQVLKSDKLTINAIGGGGKIFSQGQAQALCTELEYMEYATRPRGNVPRKLTPKGRSFFMDLLTREELESLGLLTREELARFACI